MSTVSAPPHHARRSLVIQIMDVDRLLEQLARRARDLGFAQVELSAQTARAVVIDAVAELAGVVGEVQP